MKELNGRVAIITGGGSGIGRATAIALAEAGVSILLAGRRQAKLNAVAEHIRQQGGNAETHACDVTEPFAFEQLKAQALVRFGAVHIIMNNIATVSCGLPEDIPVEEWQRAFDVNLMSIVRSNHVFLPLFIAQGEGHIINTASVDGLFGFGYDRLPYAASKAAVVTLSEGLALYLRPKGIGVTCLCPGPVGTEIGDAMNFFSENIDIHGAGEAFAMMDAADVGVMVRKAIQDDRFMVPTHAAATREAVTARAHDTDAFVDRQIDNPQILFRLGNGSGR